MVSEVYRALSNSTRREVLRTLYNRDSPIRCTASIGDEDVLTKEEHRKLIQLYHTHLPMLDNIGLIEWDPDQKIVEKGPRFDNVRSVLEVLATYDDINSLGSGSAFIAPQ